jgi:hypothetical protein
LAIKPALSGGAAGALVCRSHPTGSREGLAGAVSGRFEEPVRLRTDAPGELGCFAEFRTIANFGYFARVIKHMRFPSQTRENPNIHASTRAIVKRRGAATSCAIDQQAWRRISVNTWRKLILLVFQPFVVSADADAPPQE